MSYVFPHLNLRSMHFLSVFKCQMLLGAYLRHLCNLLPHFWLWKYILSCENCAAFWSLVALGLLNKSKIMFGGIKKFSHLKIQTHT